MYLSPRKFFIYCTLVASLLQPTYGKKNEKGVHSPSLAKRDTQTVLRRALHTSVVLGNYVFIVGGWFSTNETNLIELRDTLVVDMSTSWTNPTAITVLDVPSPTHLGQASMWADDDGETGYYFGGLATSGEVTPSQLYKFATDGAGSGNWTTIQNPFDMSGNLVNRPSSGLAAYGNGTGYILGGHMSSTSSTETEDLKNAVPLVGMLTYDMESNTWVNNSADGYSATGTADGGTMEFVSNFGPAGLLMPLGGQSFPRTIYVSGSVALGHAGMPILGSNRLVLGISWKVRKVRIRCVRCGSTEL